MIRIKRRFKKPEVKVRVKFVSSLGNTFPPTAQAVVDWACRNNCRLASFAVNQLPPTVNHNYHHTRFSTRLTDEAKAFRDLVGLSMGVHKTGWKPRGVVMAMLFFESPFWITKKHTTRDMDCDNRVKPLLDAIQYATGVPDNTNWEFHVWKIPSKLTRTTVYLFELGDLVEWYL